MLRKIHSLVIILNFSFNFIAAQQVLISDFQVNADTGSTKGGYLLENMNTQIFSNSKDNILPNVSSQTFKIISFGLGGEKLHKYNVTFNSNGDLVFYLREDWADNHWESYMQINSEYNDNGNIKNYRKEFFGGGISKQTFNYDSIGNLISVIFGDDRRCLYTYNPNGSKTKRTVESYNDSKRLWEAIFINFYLYDDFENMVVDSSIGRIEYTNRWINNRKTTYSYDFSGNVISVIYQDWLNSEYKNSYRNLYSYYSNGQRATYISQHWGDTSWVNLFKYIYTYNHNNQLLNEITYSWGEPGWSLSRRTAYKYNEFGRTSTVKEYWSMIQNNWIKTYSDSLLYDNNGNNISRIVDDEFCDHMGDQCIGLYSRRLTNFDNANRISYMIFDDSITGQKWGQATGEIVLSDNIDIYILSGHIFKFYYDNATSVINTDLNVIKDFYLSQNYPNPFNNSTVIRYQLTVNGRMTLKIFDISGKEIMTLLNKVQNAGEHSVSFNAAPFSSGVYFYQLTTSSGYKQNRKMILLK